MTRLPARELLICFSHLRWSFVWQRPQHLLSRACKEYDVLVFEEPCRKSCDTAYLEVSKGDGGVTIATPVIPQATTSDDAVDLQRALLDAFLTSAEDRTIGVLWYYTPMALAFSRHLDAEAIVYDNMDELSAFNFASPQLLALETELFGRADIVFTGGQSLYEAKRHRHANIHAYPSSIDFDHFSTARAAVQDPEDQRSIGFPRVGFFGVIDERLDCGLLAALAKLRTDWQFVMIGPVVKIDDAALPKASNLHWLGSKTYKELPHYLAGWSLGLMPFAINEATRFISPTKTPEFLAAGLPVVSTPIADVVNPYGIKGLVEIADTAEAFSAAMEGLMVRPRESWLLRVDRHLAMGSWDKTWAAMRDRIKSLPPAVRQSTNQMRIA